MPRIDADLARLEVSSPKRPATCQSSVSQDELTSIGTFASEGLPFGQSYGLVLLVPLRRKARAVLPSLEVVCAGGWLVKIKLPAVRLGRRQLT